MATKSKFSKADFRNIAPKTKLVHHIDKALMTFDEPWEFRYEPKQSDFGWHPSGHCIPKPSALYDDAMVRLNGERSGVPQNLTFRKSGFIGHFWHQLLQHVLVEKVGFAEWKDIERLGTRIFAGDTPKPFAFMTGSADVAPCVIPNEGEYVVDFKTMTMVHFKGAQNGRLPSFFGPKYTAQINVYMDFFDLEKGMIVAIAKDTPHEFCEIEFRRDQSLIDAIYEKLQFVSECIEAESRPTPLDDDHFILPLEE